MSVEFDKNEKMCYYITRDTSGYIFCPCCHKQKLLRVEAPNHISKIYVWCKYCKKEICLQSHEPEQ